MAPFTASNVWRASVLVITLLMQDHSVLASQNESMKNDQGCVYDCSAIELQMFNCSEYMNNSYTPPESHPFCCPGYFKTESGRCQICRDLSFMPRLNKCSNCKECQYCDNIPNDSKKEECTHEIDAVCHIETTPAPSRGIPCPIEGLPTTTGPQETQTTTTGPNYSNIPVADPLESNKKYKVGFWVVLPLFIILFLFVCLFCCCLFRLGKSGDEVDNPVNYREATWTEALTPLGQKMRKRKTIPCIDRGGDGGGAGVESGTQTEAQAVDVNEGNGGGGRAECVTQNGAQTLDGAERGDEAGKAGRSGQQDDATDETDNLLGTEGQHETNL